MFETFDPSDEETLLNQQKDNDKDKDNDNDNGKDKDKDKDKAKDKNHLDNTIKERPWRCMNFAKFDQSDEDT